MRSKGLALWQENKTEGRLTCKELSLAMVDFPHQMSEDCLKFGGMGQEGGVLNRPTQPTSSGGTFQVTVCRDSKKNTFWIKGTP